MLVSATETPAGGDAMQLPGDQLWVEIGGRSVGLDRVAVREADPHLVPDQARAALGFEVDEVVPGVARRVHHLEESAVPQREAVALIEHQEAAGVDRLHGAPGVSQGLVGERLGGRSDQAALPPRLRWNKAFQL